MWWWSQPDEESLFVSFFGYLKFKLQRLLLPLHKVVCFELTVSCTIIN